MRDLSKLDIPKKKQEEEVQQKQEVKNTKKKKLVIVIVVLLLAVAVGSKIINKHLKNKKAEEAKAIAESTESSQPSKETSQKLDDQNTENSDDKANFNKDLDIKNADKMTFTFYNKLKNETVEVDAVPSSERAQYKYTYIFQVASFRNMNETKYYTQKMESVGLKPKFEEVGNWIRMYIGPYDSQRAMAPDIIKLQKVGINMGFTREINKVKIEPEDQKKNDGSKEITNNKKDNKDKAN